MTRFSTGIVILAVGLSAGCKKKEDSPAPEKAAPVKVSVDSAQPGDAPPPPPAPAAPAPDAAAPGTPDAPPPGEDATLVGPKRVAQIEAWLHQFQAGDAGKRADIVKKLKAANLNPAEKALLETTRKRYGYDPLPLN